MRHNIGHSSLQFRIDFTLEGMQRFVTICMSQVKVWSKVEKSQIFLLKRGNLTNMSQKRKEDLGNKANYCDS